MKTTICLYSKLSRFIKMDMDCFSFYKRNYLLFNIFREMLHDSL